jgi:transposase
MRGVVKDERCLLLMCRMNLDTQKRQQLNQLFALNRRVMKAYLLKEGLERLWTYRYEGALLRYFESRIDQLRWPRLAHFQKLAFMLLDHLDGILNYCRRKVPFGVVEAINGNIKTILGRGRGYKHLGYLLPRPGAWPSPRPHSSFFRMQPEFLRRTQKHRNVGINLLRKDLEDPARFAPQ